MCVLQMVSVTVCWTLASHSSGPEEFCLLEYNVWSSQLMFQSSVTPPTSGFISMVSERGSRQRLLKTEVVFSYKCHLTFTRLHRIMSQKIEHFRAIVCSFL